MSGSDRRGGLRRAAIVSLLVALTGAVLGLAFAGSTTHLAAGIRIAGVDVGGMTPRAATARLEARWEELDHVPIRFTIGDQSWRLSASQLGVRPNWRAAVDSVRRQGGGFAPLRGFRRLDLRFFGTDVAPPTQVYDTALTYVLDKVSREVDSKHREASLALRGLQPVVVPGRAGRVVDRSAAPATLVRALASLERQPVELPVRIDTPRVKANDLTVVAAEVKTALSAPVRLTLAGTKFTIQPRRIATLLELPDNGRRDLRIGGRGADAWFGKLAQHVDHPPVDATWAITSQGIHAVPDRPGHSLHVPKRAIVLLHAVLVTDPSLRQGALVAQTTHAERTTREAQALQIRGLVSSYETFYGGDPNRVHNVQLVAHLVDGHVIAPGTTFSFNDATGARTADKGFRVAPVIINGELKTGLGGGVCQVSTTVFNAAYEAGLPITSRTNHALYISHYPQGRDATVNYPDTDLKFVNDTAHWLLLRTYVGSDSLTVGLYGAPQHRRVETTAAPLRFVSPPPVQKTVDATLEPGTTVVDESGVPAQATSVERKVYSPSGKLLSDSTWYSSYRSEPRGTRVGPPKPKAPPKVKKKQVETVTLPEQAPAAPH